MAKQEQKDLTEIKRRLLAAQQEKEEYLMSRTRVNLRIRIAKAADDQELKDRLYKDAERIEIALGICDGDITKATTELAGADDLPQEE
jgi:hypothetical protein